MVLRGVSGDGNALHLIGGHGLCCREYQGTANGTLLPISDSEMAVLPAVSLSYLFPFLMLSLSLFLLQQRFYSLLNISLILSLSTPFMISI